jgi:hypothetical protein
MDDLDRRDSIDVFAMILEEVLMRYFVRCEQDSGCTSARSRCGLLCCVRFRDVENGRSRPQGQYRCVCYDFRRGVDAIFL